MTEDETAKQLASALLRAATREHRYSFAQLLEYTGVPQNRAIRWLNAGIIEAASGGGSQGVRREFSLKNLIEMAVCDELRALGLSEPTLRSVVHSLQAIWSQPNEPITSRRSVTYRDAPILWLALQRFAPPDRPDTIEEMLAVYPVDAFDLERRVTDGMADGTGIAETGIAVPLGRITRDLEAKTGDVLVWG